MSYILDALRKSEDERRAKQPLALTESSADVTYRRYNWAPWLLVTLVIAGGAILYMAVKAWGPGYSESQPDITQFDSAPTTHRLEQDKRHLVARQPTAPELVAGVDTPHLPQTDTEPAAIPQRPEPKRTRVTARQTPAPEQANRDTTVVESTLPEKQTSIRKITRTLSPTSPKQAFVDAVRGQTERPPNAVQPPTKAQPRTTASRPTKVQPPLEPRPAEPAKTTPTVAAAEPVIPPPPTGRGSDPLPLLAAMPPEFQRRMSEMKVNVHFYSEDPGSRFVVINMTKYRQGQRIADGPLLEAITPDGLILQSGRKRFRMGRR